MAESHLVASGPEHFAQISPGPQVGEKAPDFVIEHPSSKVMLSKLAGQVGKVILISYDSYQFHPN
jgi:hypothetical protein